MDSKDQDVYSDVEDIYDDFADFDLGKMVDKLKGENKQLNVHIASQEMDKKKLADALVEMQTVNRSLTQNISSLYKTAKSELDRKDRIISDLRTQLENEYKRKRGNFQYSQPNIKKESSEINKVDNVCVEGKVKHESRDIICQKTVEIPSRATFKSDEILNTTSVPTISDKQNVDRHYQEMFPERSFKSEDVHFKENLTISTPNFSENQNIDRHYQKMFQERAFKIDEVHFKENLKEAPDIARNENMDRHYQNIFQEGEKPFRNDIDNLENHKSAYKNKDRHNYDNRERYNNRRHHYDDHNEQRHSNRFDKYSKERPNQDRYTQNTEHRHRHDDQRYRIPLRRDRGNNRRSNSDERFERRRNDDRREDFSRNHNPRRDGNSYSSYDRSWNRNNSCNQRRSDNISHQRKKLRVVEEMEKQITIKSHAQSEEPPLNEVSPEIRDLSMLSKKDEKPFNNLFTDNLNNILKSLKNDIESLSDSTLIDDSLNTDFIFSEEEIEIEKPLKNKRKKEKSERANSQTVEIINEQGNKDEAEFSDQLKDKSKSKKKKKKKERKEKSNNTSSHHIEDMICIDEILSESASDYNSKNFSHETKRKIKAEQSWEDVEPKEQVKKRKKKKDLASVSEDSGINEVFSEKTKITSDQEYVSVSDSERKSKKKRKIKDQFNDDEPIHKNPVISTFDEFLHPEENRNTNPENECVRNKMQKIKNLQEYLEGTDNDQKSISQETKKEEDISKHKKKQNREYDIKERNNLFISLFGVSPIPNKTKDRNVKSESTENIPGKESITSTEEKSLEKSQIHSHIAVGSKNTDIEELVSLLGASPIKSKDKKKRKTKESEENPDKKFVKNIFEVTSIHTIQEKKFIDPETQKLDRESFKKDENFDRTLQKSLKMPKPDDDSFTHSKEIDKLVDKKSELVSEIRKLDTQTSNNLKEKKVDEKIENLHHTEQKSMKKPKCDEDCINKNKQLVKSKEKKLKLTSENHKLETQISSEPKEKIENLDHTGQKSVKIPKNHKDSLITNKELRKLEEKKLKYASETLKLETNISSELKEKESAEKIERPDHTEQKSAKKPKCDEKSATKNKDSSKSEEKKLKATFETLKLQTQMSSDFKEKESAEKIGKPGHTEQKSVKKPKCDKNIVTKDKELSNSKEKKLKLASETSSDLKENDLDEKIENQDNSGQKSLKKPKCDDESLNKGKSEETILNLTYESYKLESQPSNSLKQKELVEKIENSDRSVIKPKGNQEFVIKSNNLNKPEETKVKHSSEPQKLEIQTSKKPQDKELSEIMENRQKSVIKTKRDDGTISSNDTVKMKKTQSAIENNSRGSYVKTHIEEISSETVEINPKENEKAKNSNVTLNNTKEKSDIYATDTYESSGKDKVKNELKPIVGPIGTFVPLSPVKTERTNSKQEKNSPSEIETPICLNDVKPFKTTTETIKNNDQNEIVSCPKEKLLQNATNRAVDALLSLREGNEVDIANQGKEKEKPHHKSVSAQNDEQKTIEKQKYKETLNEKSIETEANKIKNQNETRISTESLKDSTEEEKTQKESPENKIVIVSNVLLQSGSPKQQKSTKNEILNIEEPKRYKNEPNCGKMTDKSPVARIIKASNPVSKKDRLLERYASDENQNQQKSNITNTGDTITESVDHKKECKKVSFKSIEDQEKPDIVKKNNRQVVSSKRKSEKQESIPERSTEIHINPPKKRKIDIETTQDVPNEKETFEKTCEKQPKLTPENVEINTKALNSNNKPESLNDKKMEQSAKIENNTNPNEKKPRRKSKSFNEIDIEKKPGRRSARQLEQKTFKSENVKNLEGQLNNEKTPDSDKNTSKKRNKKDVKEELNKSTESTNISKIHHEKQNTDDKDARTENQTESIKTSKPKLNFKIMHSSKDDIQFAQIPAENITIEADSFNKMNRYDVIIPEGGVEVKVSTVNKNSLEKQNSQVVQNLPKSVAISINRNNIQNHHKLPPSINSPLSKLKTNKNISQPAPTIESTPQLGTTLSSPYSSPPSGEMSKPRKRITPTPVKDVPVCSFKNILEKNSHVKIFSKNLMVGSTLNLTDEGEIPILHLEENHFNNMEDGTQKTFDKSIMKLLDCMNVSNLDSSITKLNDKAETPETNNYLTFENVIQKVNATSSVVINNVPPSSERVSDMNTTPVRDQISAPMSASTPIVYNTIFNEPVSDDKGFNDAKVAINNSNGGNKSASGSDTTVIESATLTNGSSSNVNTPVQSTKGPVRFRRRCRMVVVKKD